MLANQDIRQEVIEAGLKLWQLAELLNISDGNFSRKLRHELPTEEKAKIRAIIYKLKGAD
jgi:hypothetical protein